LIDSWPKPSSLTIPARCVGAGRHRQLSRTQNCREGTPGEVNWIIETKGRIWESTAAKDAAMEDWCNKVSAQTKTTWRYKRIDQSVFGAGNFPTLTDLLAAADQRAQGVSA